MCRAYVHTHTSPHDYILTKYRWPYVCSISDLFVSSLTHGGVVAVICVCMCLCVRVCVCTCLSVCMHVSVYVRACTCMSVCMHVSVYVRVCLWVCMCLCMYVYVCVYACVCVYVCVCTIRVECETGARYAGHSQMGYCPLFRCFRPPLLFSVLSQSVLN